MWQSVSIPLTAGAGNADLNIRAVDVGAAGLITQVYIPAQSGLTSGGSTILIRHHLPDQLFSTLFTFTNPTLPFRQAPQALVYDQAGVVTTSYTYQFVQNVNVSITNGVGANLVTVWVLIG